MTGHRIARTTRLLALVAVLSACPTTGDDPIDPAETLAITTSSLPTAVVGEAYTAGIDATGGSGEYQWSIGSGALPSGLALSVDDIGDDDAVITGIPESTGEFDFVLRVVSDDQVRSRSFTIEVLGEPAPIGIETPALPPALVGARYSTHLEGAGGNGQFTWSVVGGELPAGLTLAGDSIRGTPTATDTAIIVIRVVSGGFETEKAFTMQVVANRPGFNLTAAPVVTIPAAIQPAVDAAFARWQSAITGDVSSASIPVGFFDPGDCSGFGPIANGTSADDVIVLVNIVPIDGPSRVLGQAGPCVVRGNDLPFVGVLTLDSDDLLDMDDPQEITDLVVHELGHVLGFGSLWERAELLGGTSTDPRFTGPAATAEWNALGGTGQPPVENTGGEATAGSHWRESVFDRELMTGFAEMPGTFQPLSRVSIASLADLGYSVNLGAADVFGLPAPMGPAAAAADRAAARGWDVVLNDSIRRIEADGSHTILQREPR